MLTEIQTKEKNQDTNLDKAEEKLKDIENPENKKRGMFLNEILKEVEEMTKLQENIYELITKVEKEGDIYKEHVDKIPNKELQYSKDEVSNLERFEDNVSEVKIKDREELNRLNELKIKAEKVNVDINLDELRKMQKDHDSELDEIDDKIKKIDGKVKDMKVSDRKKQLTREINDDISKIRPDISKARGKQTLLSGMVNQCEEELGDHPEMIKCKNKHKEQVERLKNVNGLMEKWKKIVSDKNSDILLQCGHSFTKKEFADYMCGLIDD